MIPKTAYAAYRQLRKPGREQSTPRGTVPNRQTGNVPARQSVIPPNRPPSAQEKLNPEFDISQEFLDSLRSLTTRDFDHATARGDAGTRVDAKYSPPSRPPSRKGNGNTNPALESCQFYGPTVPSSPNYSRPSTVPRYLARNAVGDGPNKHEGKGGVTSSGKPRALTKSKVAPTQIEKRPVSRGRSVSANSSDSSLLLSDAELRRPSSAVSKRVTFAADTVNYERESKPARKRKMAKRRRQGFPHPSRGIFLPPDMEIVESCGPGTSCRDNPYLNFNQVWTHPAARTTGESGASKLIRTERFHRLMSDLEHAHIQYNRLADSNSNDFLTQCIFKRYILVLDLALTEGHIAQVEHLLDTISKSIPVLHQNIFYYLYGPKVSKEVDINNNQISSTNVRPGINEHNCYHPDLVLTSYALARISGDLPRQDVTKMCIETILVKLCFELLEVVYSPYGSLVFRDALSTLPYTVHQAINLLKKMRTTKDTFCYIKWINNSAVQRDFRSILKNLGLLDRYGCKSEIPGGEGLQFKQRKTPTSVSNPSHSNGITVKRGNKGLNLNVSGPGGESRRGRTS